MALSRPARKRHRFSAGSLLPMVDGVRRILPYVLVAWAAASSAHAQQPIAPADGATVMRDSQIDVRVSAPDATSVTVLITAAAGDAEWTVDEIELLPVGAEWVATLRSPSIVPDRPGRYLWYPVAEGEGWRRTGPPRTISVAVPPAWKRMTAMPRSLGRRSSRPFLLSARGLPNGLSRRRFAQMATSAARRWGLRPAGWTVRTINPTDGVSVVGFASPLPGRRGLGVVRVVKAVGYVGGRPVSRRVVDRDLAINRAVQWFWGDGYPDLASYDLQTVLLHEFGHFAGNRRHAPDCSGSPLMDPLRPGEWWRTPRDWWGYDCDPSPVE